MSSKLRRLGSAISLLAMASSLAGCAIPQSRANSASGFGVTERGDVGLATRALAALNGNDIPSAISFAERAVEKTPDDAGFRALLGNAYFAGGRFASAEAAYRDALSIYADQPKVVLKLALVEIAQGKSAEAVAFLGSTRNVLNPSDYGLALALAAHPAEAIAVLEPAARAPGADARVRQNLALAYAFAGDWTNARTIAGQDIPANQLDARIQQWMKLANPAHASDQVAAVVGVTPAAADPGQPTRLALRRAETRQAEAAPARAPAPAPTPAPQAQVPQVTAVAPAPPPAREPVAVTAEAVPPAPPPLSIAQAAAAAPEAPSAFAAFMPRPTPAAVRKAAPVRRASAPAVRVPVLRRGNSTAVVQLGAYRSPQWVATAWNVVARRYGVLRSYTPMSARFDSPRGTFYRLSVKGFASDRDARLVCESLRRSGASCFVRNVAGDAPVQIASR